ncbi:MAG: hypothetical protein IPH24_09670 [Crocinitomicaceae bacterium]|nr:hypothetical protein [Crocinitomicaceae bacterium]
MSLRTMLGATQTQSTCHVCHGTGKIIDKKPAGADAQGLKRQEDVVEAKYTCGSW